MMRSSDGDVTRQQHHHRLNGTENRFAASLLLIMFDLLCLKLWMVNNVLRRSSAFMTGGASLLIMKFDRLTERQFVAVKLPRSYRVGNRPSSWVGSSRVELDRVKLSRIEPSRLEFSWIGYVQFLVWLLKNSVKFCFWKVFFLFVPNSLYQKSSL